MEISEMSQNNQYIHKKKYTFIFRNPEVHINNVVCLFKTSSGLLKIFVYFQSATYNFEI